MQIISATKPRHCVAARRTAPVIIQTQSSSEVIQMPVGLFTFQLPCDRHQILLGLEAGSLR